MASTSTSNTGGMSLRGITEGNVNFQITSLEALLNNPIHANKTFIAVEGEKNNGIWASDKQFYSPFFNCDTEVYIFESQGCGNVEKIVKHFNNSSFQSKVIGIRDADFLHITGHTPIPNLFLTDAHDWEIMATQGTDSERKMCAEMSIDYDSTLYNTVMEHLKPLSYIRLYNSMKFSNATGGINFNAVALNNYYFGDTPISTDICLNKIHGNGANSTVTPFPTEEDITQQSVQYANADLHQLTQGHDFVNALLIRYRHLRNANSNLGEKGISLVLKVAYTYEDFKRTQLWRDINTWASEQGRNLWVT